MTNLQYYKEIHATKNSERDTGFVGDCFELALRDFSSGKKQVAVKPQGKFDAYVTFKSDNGKRKAVTVEVKTACGEIDMLERAQYICYCPTVDFNYPAEEQGFIFNRDEWVEFINGYSGRGKFTRITADGHTHIQSFRCDTRPKASRTIADYIWDCCYNQPTFGEWLEELRGQA